ncbi:serine hydrolase domain-containing protein [Rhodococcus ruber]|uniref:serine hydrolase domain-containing protein n=1 Tax=Rhodococcus ruber TaxID=1830 RepID=UPI000F542B63|nr:serine hydrolase domain-containing protein [Rhodococcus ruber]RQM33705.1 serine hydrolase [Rhodococcus ruber]
MSARISRHPGIHGYARDDFAAVRQAFAENFSHRRELGAACCVYYRGEKVVDLWGGVRDKTTGAPWERDTMTLVFSATKGMTAVTVALAHSRGWLDFDERVCTYWPEFAQNGKERITVRQLLPHQAGLFGFDEPVDAGVIADPDRLAAIMARQRPEWAPGERQAYHAISLGFYQGELVRRVDPQHRTLGQVFQDEIATPLGLEFYIRLPASVPDARLAPLMMRNPLRNLAELSPRLFPAFLNKRSVFYRSLVANPGTLVALDPDTIYARDLEAPSGGGVGTARALAHAYGVLATGGAELGMRPETLHELTAPPVPPRDGFHDACMLGDIRFALGFMRPSPDWSFGGPRSFGAPGAGGSFGYADPDAGIGYGYVCNRMGKSRNDPRDVALRAAMTGAVTSA